MFDTQGELSNMDWILGQAESYRDQIRAGAFFHSLQSMSCLGDLSWTHQLFHQSREFTQALCLRYGHCSDRRYQAVFAEHAREEADHPEQLAAWMSRHGLLDDEGPGIIAPTPETVASLAFCWRSAVHDPHDVQVVVLNVLSEGVALDFYSGVIPLLQGLDLLTGRYWKVHREVDAQHLALGLDRLPDVEPNTALGQRYQRALWQAANHYHRMLSSWVDVASEPLIPVHDLQRSSRVASMPRSGIAVPLGGMERAL